MKKEKSSRMKRLNINFKFAVTDLLLQWIGVKRVRCGCLEGGLRAVLKYKLENKLFRVKYVDYNTLDIS